MERDFESIDRENVNRVEYQAGLQRFRVSLYLASCAGRESYENISKNSHAAFLRNAIVQAPGHEKAFLHSSTGTTAIDKTWTARYVFCRLCARKL